MLNFILGSAASSDGGSHGRPALPPGKTLAATMAAARQQQHQALLRQHERQNKTSLPNFNLNKEDMGMVIS